MIRVLVVEDSAVQRELLCARLEEAGSFSILGPARDGEEAVVLAERLRPDVILMDCHMPRLDGIGATREIMDRTPTPIVIASASLLPNETELSFRALSAGALAALYKPVAIDHPQHRQMVDELIRTLREMAEIRVMRRPLQIAPVVPQVPSREINSVRLVAFGGSTGAPGLIGNLLARLAGLPAPILIVQHLSEGFVAGFAEWLARYSHMPVEVAVDRKVVEPGHVYVAPDSYHLGITSLGRIDLSEAPPESGFRPSASYLFRSVASAYGASALGLVLTGMGRDGAQGMLALRNAGGVTVAQDEASCVVPGMPNEARRIGAVQHVLAPSEIAAYIAQCVVPPPPSVNGQETPCDPRSHRLDRRGQSDAGGADHLSAD
ncbi:MAG: chemotaxis protein CheB [Rhodospirillaceae bacterium]|nr:chemotaxis protein CheB [Rhodospirillaceae bacterium]